MDISAWIAGFAFALPAAALLTLLVLALSRKRKSRGSLPKSETLASEERSLRQEDPAVFRSDVIGNDASGTRDDPSKIQNSVAVAINSPLLAKTTDLARTNTPQAPGLEAESLLTLGRTHMTAGHRDAAFSALRDALWTASLAGQHAIAGQARLSLGDLAHASGDMTTACEHWQIAQDLFTANGQKADLAVVGARMRRHGCPTDWVLNGF